MGRPHGSEWLILGVGGGEWDKRGYTGSWGHVSLGCNVEKFVFMDVYICTEKKLEGYTLLIWYPSKCQTRLLYSELVGMTFKIADTQVSLPGLRSQL